MNTPTRTTRTPRRDPLEEVVDIDSLRIAFELLSRRQNFVYWSTVSVPLRPLGILHHEGLRQAATFLVPALIVALAYLFAPHTVLALGLAAAAAFLVGSALHGWLRRDLKGQLKVDRELDAGRYEGTRYLCHRLGLTPEEITLERVYKMAKDYKVVAEQLRKEAHARLSVEAARAAARDTHDRYMGRHRDHDRRDSYTGHDSYEPPHWEPAVNINGNAMVPGTGLDISGNPYGVL